MPGAPLHPQKSLVLGTMPEEDDMRTTRHSIRYVLSLVGIGLMLAGLFGGPAVSAADLEPFDYQNDWVAQYPWGPQDYRGTRDPWKAAGPLGIPSAPGWIGVWPARSLHDSQRQEVRVAVRAHPRQPRV
jgi:hypothetical protein